MHDPQSSSMYKCHVLLRRDELSEHLIQPAESDAWQTPASRKTQSDARVSSNGYPFNLNTLLDTCGFSATFNKSILIPRMIMKLAVFIYCLCH